MVDFQCPISNPDTFSSRKNGNLAEEKGEKALV
jgi:hypothetical protein